MSGAPRATRREVLVVLCCTALCFLLTILLALVVSDVNAWSWDREGAERECRAQGGDYWSPMEGCS